MLNMLNFLAGTAKAGFGLASITAAVFWSVQQGFIKANIFSTMTQDQTYKAFIWSSGIAGVLLFVAMLLSAVTKSNGKSIIAETGGIAIDNSGFLNFFKLFRNKSDDK
ncbi:hypothetical protein [Aeromonas veronii]|uniref:hypothetical protein n=1 Tax=Aeromonas TaxID=642 RepID=UPI002443D293|nr:hypothetical protein [Aeromonas veronii]